MLRLVETDLASTGKPDPRHRAPPRLFDLRTVDTRPREFLDLGPEIVTHEIEFAGYVLLGGVNGRFCRRQREDKPAVPGVHRWKPQDLPEESAISRRVVAVQDHMGPKDHERTPLERRRTRSRGGQN